MHEAATAFLDEVWPFYIDLLEKDKKHIFSTPPPQCVVFGLARLLEVYMEEGQVPMG